MENFILFILFLIVVIVIHYYVCKAKGRNFLTGETFQEEYKRLAEEKEKEKERLAIEKKNHEYDLRNTIPDIRFFKPNLIDQMNYDDRICIDTVNEKFGVIRVRDGTQYIDIIDFKNILECEICTNNVSISNNVAVTDTKTNTGNQIKRAAVGYALLGPLGGLAGGLSASSSSSSHGTTTTQQKISKLSIKLFTTDINNPSREIIFFDGLPEDPNKLPRVIKLVDDWYSRFLTVTINNRR